MRASPCQKGLIKREDASAACFFCVILSAAKDLARQRVSLEDHC